jgi:hypothetical protein
MNGETLIMYPEGSHQRRRWLGEFKINYLRIAFDAAERMNFERDVVVLPSCNHYSNYHHARIDMLMKFGKPISLKPYYEQFKESPRETMRLVNERVRSEVEALMLNVEDLDHYREIDFLRTNTYGKKYAARHSYRADYLPEKLASDKALVAALKEATERDAEKMEGIFEQTRKLRKSIEKMGIREWLLEGCHGLGGLLLFALGMLIGLPLFVAALAATWLVFLAPVVVNKLAIKDRQFWGSINLAATLLVTYPLCGIVAPIVMLCCGSWEWALGWFVAFPIAIIYASNYMRWGQKLIGYCRFVFAKRSKIENLQSLRKRLYKELDKTLK